MAPEGRGAAARAPVRAISRERDLLVGRLERAEGSRTAGAAQARQVAAFPQAVAHDDAIREIIETVRATAARIDALQGASDPEHEPVRGARP